MCSLAPLVRTATAAVGLPGKKDRGVKHVGCAWPVLLKTLTGASDLQRHVGRFPWRRADQDIEQIAHLALLDQGMTHGASRYYLVAIASAVPFAQHVSLLDQLGQDPVGGALGDPNRCGNVAQADARVMSDAGEDMGVVGQKVPAPGRGRRPLVLISGK